MAEKVGDGYIEIDTRLDDTNFVRVSEAMAQRAALRFGKTYNENLTRSLREADKQYEVHINRQISSFQSLEKQRVAATEDANRRISQLRNQIARETDSDRRLSDAYAKEGQRAAVAFEKEQMASFNRVTNAYRSGLAKMEDDDHASVTRMLGRREVDIDNHSRRGRSIIERHLFGAFDGVMSLLPSRLEFLFTRTGPLLGSLLAATLVGGAMIALPALGAMLGGALIAALGVGGAIAAAFVGAADDPRVLASARRIADTWKREIIYAPETQGIGQALADQLDKVNAALNRWAPSINSILNAGAKFLTPITDGLIGMIDKVLPALDRMMNSPFMTVMMDVISNGLVKIGEAFGVSMDRILADPQAMEGFRLGLEDAFNLIASGVKLTFDLLRQMARFWEDINRDPDGPGPNVSKLENVKRLWAEIRELIEEIVGLAKTLDGLFGGGGNGNNESGGTGGWAQELAEITESLAAINRFIDTVKATWVIFWDEFPRIAEAGMEVLRDKITTVTDGIKMRWNESWGSFKQFFIDTWTFISTFASQWLSSFGIILGSWLDGVKTRWNEAWGNTKQFFIDRWNEISTFASEKWNSFTATMGAWLDGVKTRWNESWGNVKQFFIDRWNEISGFALAIFTTIGTNLANWLGTVLTLTDTGLRLVADAWSRWWGGIWAGLTGVWNNISNSVVLGINNVIDIINKGIGLINALLTKLGVSFQITPIGHVGGSTTPQPLPGMGNFSKMKTGGPVRGPGSGTADRVPILASNGEFVVNAKQTRRFFPLISAINSGQMRGFAEGGYISMFNWIKQRVPGVSMSSGFRAGDPGYHGKGMAIDMIFSDGSERRGGGLAAQAFNMIKSAFMPVIRELIWDFAGGNAVWNGKNHFFTGSGAGPGTHNDHIHWAQGTDATGGLLSGLFEWLGKGWNALIDELITPMKNSVLNLLPQNNGIMAMGRGWANVLLDQVIAKIKVEFDQAQESLMSLGTAGDFSGNGLAGAMRWSSTATQALKMLGLPLSWLGPLLTLIGRESGGNPSAINRWDSNAAKGQPSQGLMQTIPSTFNAHKLPGYNNILAPLDNILAGLRYIVAVYGSIFNVQQANSRMSPAGYAKGGKFYPGQLALNETRKPEAILNQSQWDALANSSGNVDVTVMIDGVEVAHKTVVEKNNKDITQAFRRGRGVF